MIILGEEAQVEGRFDLFGDSAILDGRYVHGLHGTYHMLRNPFGRTPIELLDDMCHMESRFGLLRDRVSFGAR
jgi:hypothetical protein